MASTTTAPDQSSTKPHYEKEVATILKANNDNASPATEVGEKGEESLSSETARTEPMENISDRRDRTMPTKEENYYKVEPKENYSEVAPGTSIAEEKGETEMSKKMESASNGTASESNGKVHDNKHGTTVVEDKHEEEHGTNYGCEDPVGINRKVEESANLSVDVVEKEEQENVKDKESDDKLNQMIQNCEKREKGIDRGSSDSEVPVVTNVEPQNVNSLADAEKEVLETPNKIASPFNERVAVEADEKLYDIGKGTHVGEPTDKTEENKDSCADQSVGINKTELIKPEEKESASSEPATTGSDNKICQMIQNREETENKIEGKSSGSKVPVDVAKDETESVNSSAHTGKQVLEPRHVTDESPINETVKVETDEKGKGAQTEERTKKVEENKDSCANGSAGIKKTEQENPEDKESASSEAGTTTEADNKISRMIQNCEETEKEIEGKSSGSKVPVDVTKAEPKNLNSSAYTEKEVPETQNEVELPANEKLKVETGEELYEKGKRTHIEELIKKVEDNKDSCADESVDIKKDELEIPKDKESANSGPATTGPGDKINQKTQNCKEKEKERDGRSSDSEVPVGDTKVEPQNVNSSAHTEREVLETQNKIGSSINETVNVESDKKRHEKGREAQIEEPTKKVEDKVSYADESAGIKKVEQDIGSPPINNEEKKLAVFLTESEHRKDEKTPFEEKKINEKGDKKSGPEVSYDLPKAQDDATTPQTDIDHKEDGVPKNKETPTSEYIVEGSHGMAHINKDEITPIEEKTEKDDCRNLSSENSTENSLKEEIVVVASSLQSAFEVVEKKTDEKSIDSLEISGEKVEKLQFISEAISNLEVVQEVRKEPEDSASTGEGPNDKGSANETKEAQCEITKDISAEGAEAAVKKDALPDGTPETLIYESSKAVVSEIVDPTEQKESLSDDVSKVEEPPKPHCEEFAKPEDNVGEGNLNSVSMDKSPLVDPPKVENVPISDCSARVIKNESVEGTKNEDVKEEVQKFPEISKEMVNESKLELQVNQAVRENMETDEMKKSATKIATEKTLESFKDENDSKVDIETTKEEDNVKHAHHSSNIISKVKHSIVKVKKKIMGKSPCSKNVSPEVKT